MSTSAKSSSKKSNLFRRLDIYFPWLKLVVVIFLGVVAILDLFDLTISKANEFHTTIKIAPMSHHVRVTKRILEGKMLVALTFDDGPSSATTPELLDILYREDVPSTFFVLGKMARGNPDIIRRAESEGHVVASHTMYHQNLVRISASAVKDDINEANSVFEDILDHLPVLTRPPYGNINSNVRSAASSPLILWSVDTLDWKNEDVDSIMETALSEVHDGAIILMHDIYPTTVEAVPILIDTLRDSGYEFVTVPELAKIRGVELVDGEAYYNFRP